MKYSLFLLVLCFTTNQLSGQKIYSRDATWLTLNLDGLSHRRTYNYIHYQQDSIINGKQCIIYQVDGMDVPLWNDTTFFTEKNAYIFHEDQNKAFQFKNDSFKLLYDFNLTLGDTVQITLECWNDTIPINYTLDSITPFNMDPGAPLTQHFRAAELEPNIDFNGSFDSAFQIVKGLGVFNHGAFNMVPEPFLYCSTDPPAYFLFCYGDPFFQFEIEYRPWGEDDPCQTYIELVPIQVLESLIPVKIYPNPTYGYLHVDVQEQFEVFETAIYSLDGKLLRRFSLNDSRLNLFQISSGMYILKVLTPRSFDSYLIQKF